MDEVPPELLAWTFESCLTEQHLRILPFVCRRWRDVCASAALRRAMLRGLVFSFGGGDSHFDQSALGHPRQEEGVRWAAPARIGALRGLRIAAVAAGENHSLFLTDDGQVYACGVSLNGSQLGFAGCREEDLCQMHYVPERVSGLDDVVVVKIAAGPTHSLVLTSTAAVYSFGENRYGHLGLGDYENRWTPTLVEALRGEEIVQVVAGDTNSAAITKSGQVFMWGSCRSCIDLPSNDPTKPTLVEALSGTPIAAVALGECHCLFLTTDGLVLSCGLDLYHSGLLGYDVRDNPRKEQRVPRPIPHFTGAVAAAIAAGEGHSLVLTRDGRLFAFGDNRSGQLGLGRTSPELNVSKPTELPSPVAALAHVQVAGVVAAPLHSCAIAHDGSVYSFGDGEFYQLGHGTTDSWNVPKKIDALVPFFMTSIASTRAHTLALL